MGRGGGSARKEREKEKREKNETISAVDWLSPAQELTLNTRHISTPYSNTPVGLVYYFVQWCSCAGSLSSYCNRQTHPEALPPSVCLQTEAHSHLLDWDREKLDQEKDRSMFAPLRLNQCWGYELCWWHRQSGHCSSGLNQEKHTWEKRRLWQDWCI